MERQLYNDYSGIKNDYLNAYQPPTYGGNMYGTMGPMGTMDGGDFWSDFADGFMMVMNPVIDTVKTVAPFLPLIGLGEENCSCGMRGGDEVKDTDMIGMMDQGLPQRYAQYFLGGRRAKSVPSSERRMLLRKALADLKFQKELKMLMKARKRGSGMSGGDGFDWSSLLSFAPLLLGLGEDDGEEVYADMMGEGFWDDVGDFFTSLPSKALDVGKSAYDTAKSGLSEASKVATELKPLLDVFKALSGKKEGEGLSGGELDYIKALCDTYNVFNPNQPEQPREITGGRGRQSRGGAGVSGGMYDKSKYPDMGAGVSGGSTQLARLLAPDLAGIYDMATGKNPLTGEGISGGAMTYEQNMNMADAMGDIFSGMGYPYDVGNAGDVPLNIDAPPRNMPQKNRLLPTSDAVQLYKGGDTSVNAPYVSGDTRIPINLQNRPTKKYLEMTGNGVSGGDWWSDFTDGLSSVLGPIGDVAKVVAPFLGEGAGEMDRAIGSGVSGGAGVSGGKRSSRWIEHVKAYARQHNIKYNEALKRAGATYKK
jgi:hypothetical protein